MERETRFIPAADAEVRAGDGGARGISGMAAVYDRSTIISGMWEERIAPGAFDDVLGDDVRALFNHDPNYPLGRTKSGTLVLRAEKSGLRYEVPELPQARADVLEAIQRGDVTGSSFSFRVEPDGETWENRSKDGLLPLRTITRIAKLPDLGPVTWPAYQEAKVSARCEERAREMAAKDVPAPQPIDTTEHHRLLAAAEQT